MLSVEKISFRLVARGPVPGSVHRPNFLINLGHPIHNPGCYKLCYRIKPRR